MILQSCPRDKFSMLYRQHSFLTQVILRLVNGTKAVSEKLRMAWGVANPQPDTTLK